jgi:hypothetical protein
MAVLQIMSHAHAVIDVAHFVWRQPQVVPASTDKTVNPVGVQAVAPSPPSSVLTGASLPPSSLPEGPPLLLLEHATATAPAPKSEAPSTKRHIRMTKPSCRYRR